MLKAIADENRAKITYALCQEDELCVCDIANILGVTVANASHHLRTLYKQRIVNYRKEGKLSFYSLNDEHIKQIMMIALTHKKEVDVNAIIIIRSEEHTSELQSRGHLVCRLLLEKKKIYIR